MTSGIVIFSSKTNFLEVEMSVGHFRPFEELNLAYTREQIKQKKKDSLKDGMALLLIPEGGLHSSRYFT